MWEAKQFTEKRDKKRKTAVDIMSTAVFLVIAAKFENQSWKFNPIEKGCSRMPPDASDIHPA